MGVLGEFGGDLDGGVAGANDDDTLAVEWFGGAVLRGVQHGAGEVVEAR